MLNFGRNDGCLEFEQESDSQIWKKIRIRIKDLEQERSRSLKMWLRQPLMSTSLAYSQDFSKISRKVKIQPVVLQTTSLGCRLAFVKLYRGIFFRGTGLHFSRATKERNVPVECILSCLHSCVWDDHCSLPTFRCPPGHLTHTSYAKNPITVTLNSENIEHSVITEAPQIDQLAFAAAPLAQTSSLWRFLQRKWLHLGRSNLKQPKMLVH